MSTRPMAQLAIQNLDNTIPNGATEPIYVKYADEEGKKRHGPFQNHNGHNRGFGGHHQNHHQNNFQSNNFMNQQQHGFNFNSNNQFMMSNNQNQLNQLNNLNLGKMKNNRSNNQNRYNPIGGATGFDNLINTIGTGAVNTGSSLNTYNHPTNFNQQNLHASHPQQIQHQQQQHFGSGSNTNNLLDLSNPHINIGNKVNNSSTIGSANGHIIYVYGIGQANESDLYSLFSNCGRILRVNVIKNQKTGQCKGYGFVVFDTYEEAFYAVHNMNGYMYNHRPLQVQLNAGHNE